MRHNMTKTEGNKALCHISFTNLPRLFSASLQHRSLSYEAEERLLPPKKACPMRQERSKTGLRHEWKHEITYADMLALRSRLKAVARPDTHAKDGQYRIRSLYFDTLTDKALREKADGVSRRIKFRIRCYNGDFSRIRLEKKIKAGGLCGKESAPLTAAEVSALLAGDSAFMREKEDPLIREFYARMTAEGLMPKTIVEYVREPYVFAPGNVRVTIDRSIRTGLSGTDFLAEEPLTVPVPGDPIILEVKWDAYLPDIIRDAVQLESCRSGPFSKYAACRIYG